MSNGEPLPPAPPTNWWKIVIPWLGWVLAVVATIVAARLGVQVPLPPPPPMEVPAQGWVQNPDAVAAVVAELEFKSFADTPAGKNDDPLPKFAYLWKAELQKTGKLPPDKDQNPVGSCVAFGTDNAAERTMAVDVVTKNTGRIVRLVEEVTYAGSRVEIGKGRIRGDGSNGSWAAKFLRDYGVAERKSYLNGKYDLTSYDPQRCRSWGNSGVPDDLEPLVKEHPVQTITQVPNWTEAKKALASGYGIAVCSGQGFSMTRDSRGVARAQGSWAHCMCLDGYHIDADGKEYGHIQNSWGPDAHKGPVGWGDPSPGGFWAESRVIEGMLREGDSWAFSTVVGFPARKIDWMVWGPRWTDDSYTVVNFGVPARRKGERCEPLFSLAP